ncbi:hypothetical protein KC332_g9904 [Hortaea werneckii]|uniref:Uncharacterized protein n=2 Tax=Hortaea werneckii TaxID=91943 RepID=A0A3M7I7D3_HORWE|nr:hypothetical protein KC358_g9768 [Hortaea werneckii]OTA21740.1 hypothetical protein BTJ68_14915 [Hortaea werneckii EXF-2000]KAI6823338.1 hypothetical protein KC350_g9249 [Hortaea werneckii]KAI6922153.1 hypothetical protein KC348_g9894 [Hortaea werneckii]KAI6931723.1 hypothetical protein KC341_g9442 [Hortaea werneckii]
MSKQQQEREFKKSSELPGPSSKHSKHEAPRSEQSVEAEGLDGRSTAAGETPLALRMKEPADSTVVEDSGKDQKQGHSAGSSNKGGEESLVGEDDFLPDLRTTPSFKALRERMAQEMNESMDSESAAGMGVSVEKTRDHQTRRNRRTGPKVKQGDFLKNQYDELGNPLEKNREQALQVFDEIFEPIIDEGLEDSEDSESE